MKYVKRRKYIEVLQGYNYLSERAKFKVPNLLLYMNGIYHIQEIQLCALFHTINHLYVIDYNINLSKIRCIESYIIHSVYSRKLNDLWYSYIFSWIILTHIAIRLIYMQSINKIIMFCALLCRVFDLNADWMIWLNENNLYGNTMYMIDDVL